MSEMTRDEIMRGLENLTPLGSEFHNDPQRCFDYILEDRRSKWEIIKDRQRRNRKLDSIAREFAEWLHVEEVLNKAKYALSDDARKFLDDYVKERDKEFNK